MARACVRVSYLSPPFTDFSPFPSRPVRSQGEGETETRRASPDGEKRKCQNLASKTFPCFLFPRTFFSFGQKELSSLFLSRGYSLPPIRSDPAAVIGNNTTDREGAHKTPPQNCN